MGSVTRLMGIGLSLFCQFHKHVKVFLVWPGFTVNQFRISRNPELAKLHLGKPKMPGDKLKGFFAIKMMMAPEGIGINTSMVCAYIIALDKMSLKHTAEAGPGETQDPARSKCPIAFRQEDQGFGLSQMLDKIFGKAKAKSVIRKRMLVGQVHAHDGFGQVSVHTPIGIGSAVKTINIGPPGQHIAATAVVNLVTQGKPCERVSLLKPEE